jgi:hypothetical protein
MTRGGNDPESRFAIAASLIGRIARAPDDAQRLSLCREAILVNESIRPPAHSHPHRDPLERIADAMEYFVDIEKRREHVEEARSFGGTLRR